MPGQLDATFLPLASRLLEQFGESVTLTQRSGETYNPATGAVTSTATATCSVYGYIDQSSIAQRDGDVSAGSMVVILPAQDVTFDVAPGDTVRVRGVDWTVADEIDRQASTRGVSASVRKISSGSADVLLYVRVRR
jgi:hypothetical protein